MRKTGLSPFGRWARFFHRSLITQIIREDRLDASVVGMAKSAAEAITFVKSNPDLQLVFLDLDFGKHTVNDIDLSLLLRKNIPGMRVVFTTNSYFTKKAISTAG